MVEAVADETGAGLAIPGVSTSLASTSKRPPVSLPLASTARIGTSNVWPLPLSCVCNSAPLVWALNQSS